MKICKQRIKEVIDSDGDSKFIIQTRFMFIWSDFISFKTKAAAEEWIKYDDCVKTVIHYVD